MLEIIRTCWEPIRIYLYGIAKVYFHAPTTFAYILLENFVSCCKQAPPKVNICTFVARQPQSSFVVISSEPKPCLMYKTVTQKLKQLSFKNSMLNYFSRYESSELSIANTCKFEKQVPVGIRAKNTCLKLTDLACSFPL